MSKKERKHGPTGRDLRLLGLPTSFPEEGVSREDQFRHAVVLGANKVEQRFSGLSARDWQPTSDLVQLLHNREEFIAAIVEHSGQPEQTARRYVEANNNRAWSDYRTGIVLFDTSRITTPVDAAIAGAHESVHQRAGAPRVKFRGATIMFETSSDTLRLIEDFANESLTQYAAFEALGLLNPPITRIQNFATLLDAYQRMIIRQLAVPLGPNAVNDLFRITQGTFTEQEVAELDRRMGAHPRFRNWDSYFDRGILYPTAAIGNPQYMHDQKGALGIMLRNIFDWMRAVNQNEEFDFYNRPDVTQAGSRIESTGR